MLLTHRLMLTGLPVATLAASPALAQTAELTITVPRLSVAEYHRPYVAAWIEAPGKPAQTMFVWFDTKLKNNEGQKWLRDVRQWWRASGRTLALPNAVSGATRAPGTHKVALPIRGLAGGQYTLVVEAAREGGGRELLRLPFAWPPKGNASAAGKTELGAVSLAFRR